MSRATTGSGSSTPQSSHNANLILRRQLMGTPFLSCACSLGSRRSGPPRALHRHTGPLRPARLALVPSANLRSAAEDGPFLTMRLSSQIFASAPSMASRPVSWTTTTCSSGRSSSSGASRLFLSTFFLPSCPSPTSASGLRPSRQTGSYCACWLLGRSHLGIFGEALEPMSFELDD